MPIELLVPKFGESVTEGVISKWHKREGEPLKLDENVVEIESDKATSDLPSPTNGRMGKILKQPGEKVLVGEVIGYVLSESEAGGAAAAANPNSTGAPSPTGPAAPTTPPPAAPSGPATVPVTNQGNNVSIGTPQSSPAAAASNSGAAPFVMPAAQTALDATGVNPAAVTATGPGNRLLKEDVYNAAAAAKVSPPPAPHTAPAQQRSGTAITKVDAPLNVAIAGNPAREENLVVMSPIRQRIAQRLVEAQATAAMLTTFNEIDMTEVMGLRAKFNDKDAYKERHGVKLGFTSFFVKAAVDALRLFPAVNAEIREPHIVYKNFYDIGIAVGGGKGLVVPVVRNAELLSFAQIEKRVADFGKRAGENKIKLDELAGGTFTISNGGVYGSLLSTPILNPPQSGILGLHAIQDRPVARNGQVVIRPMMYVALTYDHRVVDGREAVTFLKRIKEAIEDPARLLVEV